MPGSPATSPHYGIPRYSQSDPATFATQINAVIDQIDAAIAGIPVGGYCGYAGDGDPADARFKLADGRLLDRTTVASPFFAVAGHKYNGGVDPGSNMVRLPDKRGRVSVGADNMGTAQGAAGRLPNSNRTAGSNGGEEQHTLATTELPPHTHDDGTLTAAAHTHSGPSHTHTISGTAASAGAHTHSAQYGYFVEAQGPPTAMSAAAGSAVDTGGSNVPQTWTGHTATGSAGAHTHTLSGTAAAAGTGSTGSATPDVTGATGSTGGGGGHGNMQPYEVDNVLVRIA
jgi:microcystin-dependent protein